MNNIGRAAFLVLLWLPEIASAYVGPGVGLTAIGSVLAFVGTVLLLLVGFVWYPLKRLIRYFKQVRGAEAANREHAKGDETGDEH